MLGRRSRHPLHRNAPNMPGRCTAPRRALDRQRFGSYTRVVAPPEGDDTTPTRLGATRWAGATERVAVDGPTMAVAAAPSGLPYTKPTQAGEALEEARATEETKRVRRSVMVTVTAMSRPTGGRVGQRMTRGSPWTMPPRPRQDLSTRLTTRHVPPPLHRPLHQGSPNVTAGHQPARATPSWKAMPSRAAHGVAPAK